MYPCCVWDINISLTVGSQFIIFIPLFLLSPFFATWEHFLSEWSHALESGRVLAGAVLWLNSEGGLFSLRLIQSRLKTFCTAPGSLSLASFVCSVTARTLGGGTGRLTSPVFIAASQNIHEICPTERLPFTPSHSLLIPPQHPDLLSFTP